MAIGEIKKKQLLDPTSPDYRIHPVLSDYILSKMAVEKDINETHIKIADLFENLWKSAPTYSALSAQYGSLTYYHSILAGKFNKAKEIQAVYLLEAKNAGIELYKNRNYADAMKYLEAAKEMNYENPDPIYDYYYALCLDRLSDTNRAIEIMKDLIKKEPSISRYYHSLGLFQRKMKMIDDALESFRQAITYAQGKAKIIPTISLALLLFENSSSYNNYLSESRNIILNIYDDNQYNPYVVDAAAKILIKNEEVDFAIHVLSKALNVTPNDPKLHHRIGMILKDTGNYIAARDYLENAVKSPRPNVSVYSALADVYLNLKDDKKAEQVLEQFPGSKWNDPAYLCTKANILRFRNKLKDAEPLIERAIDIAGNDPLIYSCAVQIKIDKVRNACSIGMRQEALIALEEAKKYLKMGLELDPDYDGLLSLKHNLEEVQLHYGLK
jgi:tetratricopeptide (TPR) repeat protein